MEKENCIIIRKMMLYQFLFRGIFIIKLEQFNLTIFFFIILNYQIIFVKYEMLIAYDAFILNERHIFLNSTHLHLLNSLIGYIFTIVTLMIIIRAKKGFKWMEFVNLIHKKSFICN